MDSEQLPAGFRLFPAFSVETLAEELMRELDRRSDPFVSETVLITNYAQRIWLQHFIAEHSGICANMRFLSPEKFLNDLTVSADGSTEDSFGREALTWRIFKMLCALHRPEARTPENFRFDFRENHEEDFILLAQMLADLFWRYQSFRPEMIAAWTRGNDPAALPKNNPEFLREYARQKNLWQALALHDSEIPALRYLQMLDKNTAATQTLPPRIFVFAPTAIPRVHFEMLKKLSERTEILFFYHNLSSDLWTETQNEKTIRREARKRPQLAGENKWIEYVRGNELLTSWGKAARMLAMTLVDANRLYADSTNGDTPPIRDSLLHCLQADIRENAETPNVFAQSDIPEALSDDFCAAGKSVSLRIHAAHSPMREMEILRDDLRDLFSRDSTILPRDVLVMLPDVDAYAPFIRAVFGNSEFPFSLADNAGAERFSGISALLSLLKIAQGEARISEMLALLDAQPVLRKLNIDEKEVDELRKMLVGSQARWGLDARSREEKLNPNAEELPDSEKTQRVFYNNSWEFASRRCALGVMLGDDFTTDESSGVFKFGNTPEIVPFENIPRNAATLFGKFSRILTIAKALHTHFSGPGKSLDAWCRFLKTDVADALLKFSDEEQEEAELLSNAIEALRRAGEIAGMRDEDTCSLKTVTSLLENRPWTSEHGAGMLRGKITFCQLQPLRNIPAKAIYIAGMSNGQFPHSAKRSAFDLIAQWHGGNATALAFWDRNARDEDCLLLLEALLAAQSYLRFSYVGRNTADNSEIPPCTPLAKLIDVASQIVPETRFCFEHSPHAPETETVLEKRAENSPTDPLRFLLERGEKFPLSEQERERFSELSTEQLCEFFAEPAEFICRNRLSLTIPREEKPVSDDDPESTEIKTKSLLRNIPELLSEITLNATAHETIESRLREKLQNLLRRERASGNISALTDLEESAQNQVLKLKALVKNLVEPVSGAPLKSSSITLERLSDSRFSKTLCLHPETENAPETVNLHADFENVYRVATKEKLVFLEVKPSVYSTEWELKIHTAVSAAFLRESFPGQDFVLAVFPAKSLEDGKIGIVRSENVPAGFLKTLVRKFFDGLVAPPLLFAKMPLPKKDKKSGIYGLPEAFLQEFVKAEADGYNQTDFARPYRKLVFGEDCYRFKTVIESASYDFALEVAQITE